MSEDKNIGTGIQNENNAPTPGSKSNTFFGHHIVTTVDMEPGSAYDDQWDSYCITALGLRRDDEQCIFFSTLDEISEFSRHLTEYLRTVQL